MSGLLLALLSQAPPPSVPTPQLMDRVVAVVGGSPILLSELNEAYLFYRSQMPAPMTDPAQEEKMMRQILDELVNNKLLYYHARQDTTTRVTPDEVKAALEGQIEQMRQALGDSAFSAQLREEGLTVEGLEKRYKTLVEQNLYIQRFVETKVKPLVKVTTDEVKAYYEVNRDSIPPEPARYRLSHILMLVEASAVKEQEAYVKAKSIAAMAKEDPANFASLAERFSDDRQTAKLGGKLGRVPPDVLGPVVAKALGKLKQGDVSKPLRGQYGYHIFLMEGIDRESFTLSHILVKVIPSGADSAKTFKTAKNILKRLTEGTSTFESQVKKYSVDEASKGLGGDLGWVSEYELPEQFLEALRDMKPGELKGPVVTDFGVHILKLSEVEPGRELTYEDVQEQLRFILEGEKVQAEIDKVLERAKSSIYVEVRL